MVEPGGCLICRLEYVYSRRQSVGFTLQSDHHIGSAHTDMGHIREELEEAKVQGDTVLCAGDMFDAILPKDMKRFSPDALHPKIRGRSDVLNAAIDLAVELFAPFADQIGMIGCGNHDLAVNKWHGFDPVSALVSHLQRERSSGSIYYGGYQGFCELKLTRNGGGTRRVILYYNHGFGGESPVTKGMIDFNRLRSDIDADVYWIGHKHNRFVDNASPRMRCPRSGASATFDPILCCMTSAYMRTHEGQAQSQIASCGYSGNYATLAGGRQKPIGGVRLLASVYGRDGDVALKAVV